MVKGNRPGDPGLPKVAYAQSLLLLARDAVQRGRYAEAQAYYEQAVTADPDSEQAWLELAALVQDPELSRALYRRVLHRWPFSIVAAQALEALDVAGAGTAPFVAPVGPDAIDRDAIDRDAIDRDAIDRVQERILLAGAPIYRAASHGTGSRARAGSSAVTGPRLARGWLPGTLWLVIIVLLLLAALVPAIALFLR